MDEAGRHDRPAFIVETASAADRSAADVFLIEGGWWTARQPIF